MTVLFFILTWIVFAYVIYKQQEEIDFLKGKHETESIQKR